MFLLIKLDFQINFKMASRSNSRLGTQGGTQHTITSLFDSQGSQRHEPSQEVHILNRFL